MDTIFLFVMTAVGALVISLILWKSNKQEKARQTLAARLPEGEVVDCSVRFNHRGRTVWLAHSQGTRRTVHKGIHFGPLHYSFGTHHHDKHEPSATVLRFDLGERKGLGVYVETEGLLGRLAKAVGLQDIEVGDPEFDKLFMVQGEDREEMLAFLTPEVCRALIEIYWLPSKGLLVNEEGSTLLIRKGGLIDDPDVLESFANMGAEVFDGYLQARGEVFPVSGAVCPVCNEPLSGQASVCEECGECHHPGCFAASGCGRCGGRAFRASAR